MYSVAPSMYSKNDEPLEDNLAANRDRYLKAKTNAEGEFSFANVPGGKALQMVELKEVKAGIALLPLLSRRYGSGAGIYTLLLASMGVGAVAAGLALPWIRARGSNEQVVGAGAALYGLASVAAALSSSLWAGVAAMTLAGVAWICTANTLMVAAQLVLPYMPPPEVDYAAGFRTDARARKLNNVGWVHRTGIPPDPVSQMAIFFTKEGIQGAVELPELQDLFARVAKAADPVERGKLIRAIGDVLYNGYHVLPLVDIYPLFGVNQKKVGEWKTTGYYGFTHLEYAQKR